MVGPGEHAPGPAMAAEGRGTGTESLEESSEVDESVSETNVQGRTKRLNGSLMKTSFL